MNEGTRNWIGPLREGSARGYINWDGAWVLKTCYENLGEFREDRAAFVENGRLGFIDAEGMAVIPAQFDGQYAQLPVFREGLAPVTRGDKAVYVDRNGGIAFEKEKAVPWNFVQGKAVLGRSDRYAVIDRA